jgi:hypothetical protein
LGRVLYAAEIAQFATPSSPYAMLGKARTLSMKLRRKILLREGKDFDTVKRS